MKNRLFKMFLKFLEIVRLTQYSTKMNLNYSKLRFSFRLSYKITYKMHRIVGFRLADVALDSFNLYYRSKCINKINNSNFQ